MKGAKPEDEVLALTELVEILNPDSEREGQQKQVQSFINKLKSIKSSDIQRFIGENLYILGVPLAAYGLYNLIGDGSSRSRSKRKSRRKIRKRRTSKKKNKKR